MYPVVIWLFFAADAGNDKKFMLALAESEGAIGMMKNCLEEVLEEEWQIIYGNILKKMQIDRNEGYRDS